jgi:hypothetical protein
MFALIKKHLGVRYIYEEVEPSIKKTMFPEITPADLAGLPKELLPLINTAAKGAVSKELLKLLEQIPPDLTHVADAMADLVGQYQFSRIIA